MNTIKNCLKYIYFKTLDIIQSNKKYEIFLLLRLENLGTFDILHEFPLKFLELISK